MARILYTIGAVILLITTSGTIAEHSPKTTPGIDSIKHIVFVLMENHAYDNYFGTYCQKVSSVCPNVSNGIPAGVCLPFNLTNLSKGCLAPYDYTKLVSGDPGHDWNKSHEAYDNGSMDGFVQANGKISAAHYNGTTLPVYWDIAQQFGLGDAFFSSTLTYSLPNHWYTIAATTPAIIQTYTLAGLTKKQNHEYLNEANTTPTVEQELDTHPNVTWTYYNWNLANYTTAINTWGPLTPGSAYALWNPLASKNQSYTQSSHFAGTPKFFKDVTSGHLSQISWIAPEPRYSDHPPSNLTKGENFISSIVNAISSTGYWNNTAIFVSWDDWGGFYDHVAPPQIDRFGLSFRVPLLVVSPWTPAGFISNTTESFESILHFIEYRFGLGCLEPRDCNATLPMEYFNWTMHRMPVIFGNANTSKYPMTTKHALYLENPNDFAPEYIANISDTD